MPLGDVTYQNASLDAVVDSWPASGAEYRLYSSDPSLATLLSDAELTSAGGYAPVAFAPADWADADAGSKTTTADVDFGTSTDAYSDTATYWAIVDSGDLIVYSDELDDPIAVGEASTAVSFSPTLSFADGD